MAAKRPPRRSKKPRGAEPVWLSRPPEFEALRRMALAFDGAEEGTSYGTPAFFVKGKLFARLREDGESLVVRVADSAQREELRAGDPEVYFPTDHYLNYPWVLVRLARAHPDALGGARGAR
jgi:hypothetical protein